MGWSSLEDFDAEVAFKSASDHRTGVLNMILDCD